MTSKNSAKMVTWLCPVNLLGMKYCLSDNPVSNLYATHVVNNKCFTFSLIPERKCLVV